MSFVAWGFRKDKIIYQEFHTLEFSPGYAALLVSVCVCEGGEQSVLYSGTLTLAVPRE